MVLSNEGRDIVGPAAAGAARPLIVTADWPVRTGVIPPLADRFSTRPETGPDLRMALARSPAVALTPQERRHGAGSSHDWLRATGKTQFAVHYAESMWRSRAVDLLVWVDASSAAAAISGYVAAARALAGRWTPGIADSAAASFLGWLAVTDRPWLVVLDDVLDGAALRSWWPAGPAGQVIMTTASPQAVTGLRDVLPVELGPFSRREAMSYLVGRLSADPDQRRGAIDLIEDMECQPLALAQATAAIAGSWMTCADYREQYAERAAIFNSPDAAPLPAAGVTWTLCVDHADRLLPGGSAQACLALAALLDGHGVAAEVFAAPAACRYITGTGAASPQAVERAHAALRVLDEAGLVNLDRGDPPLVRIDPVLQRAVRAAMSPEMLEQAVAAAAAALLESWRAREPNSPRAQSFRGSADALRRAAGGLLWAGGCHPLLLRAGQSLDEAALAGPAVDYWSELTAIGDQVFGAGHPETMVTIERLASAYVAAGRVGDAVAWYQRLVVDWGKAYGPDHPRTLAARVRLGRVLITAELFGDAIGVLTAALTDAERAYGPGHQECMVIRDEVAAGYRASGDLGEAIRLYRLILGDRERALGADHPDTLGARQSLAEAYLADGRVKDAFAQYKKTIGACERGQGPDHPDTLRARAALATAYAGTGRMAQAVQLHELVHAGFVRILSSDHPDTIAAARDLGRLYYRVGRLGDARLMLEAAVTSAERVLPPADPVTMSARDSLAAIVGRPS